jgi:hypothetical protein
MRTIMKTQDVSFSIGPDPDVMTRKEGGGCLSVFGIPFILFGLLFMLLSLNIMADTPYVGYMFFFCGFLFATVGACLAFNRSGLTLDRRRGTAVRWWGLIFPMKRWEILLGQVESVVMTPDPVDRDAEEPLETFTIELIGRDLEEPFFITRSYSDYETTRRYVEGLARFLDKPIEDVSSASRHIREPDRLDESFRDRVRRTGEDVRTLPPMPPVMQTKIIETEGGVVLEIPERHVKHVRYGPAIFNTAFGVILICIVAYNLLPSLPRVPGPPVVISGLFFFILGLLLWTTMSRNLLTEKRQTLVTVDSENLRVEYKKGGETHWTQISLEGLEDLILHATRSTAGDIGVTGRKRHFLQGNTGTPRMPDGRPVPKFLISALRRAGSPGITARSDKYTVTFGTGLPDDEVAYLYSLIRKIIAGNHP